MPQQQQLVCHINRKYQRDYSWKKKKQGAEAMWNSTAGRAHSHAYTRNANRSWMQQQE